MKRYVHNDPVVLEIEVFTDHLIFYKDAKTENLIASRVLADSRKYKVPEGQVISKYRERVTQRMVSDFEEFVETIEDLCEDEYDLILTYRNVSPDHSHYYNYLATDQEGNIIIDLRLRLRVSNHDAKRSPAQKRNKKEELVSEKLHQLLSQSDIDKLMKYPKEIVVNDSIYDSYEQAFEDAKEIIDEAVQKMTKKAQGRTRP